MKTRIRELRARYDLTQEDLARKVGVRRETILFLEKGKYNPSLQLAHDVARALTRPSRTSSSLKIIERDEASLLLPTAFLMSGEKILYTFRIGR